MVPDILSDMTNELSEIARDAIAELWVLFCDLDRGIISFDKKIEAVFRGSATCQRIILSISKQGSHYMSARLREPRGSYPHTPSPGRQAPQPAVTS
jgi:hypothetical protein